MPTFPVLAGQDQSLLTLELGLDILCCIQGFSLESAGLPLRISMKICIWVVVPPQVVDWEVR